MTGKELHRVREHFGLTQETFGRALGYSGSGAVVSITISRLEHDKRPIPTAIALLAAMYWVHGEVPPDIFDVIDESY
jgi:transcriptional regulator with XRE-family HTH domain